MRISIIQMEIEDGNKDQNVDKVLALIERCKNPDFIVLPELWSTGLAFHDSERLAETLTGPTISLLTECAAAHGTYIIGSILEENNNVYNTLHVVGPRGLLGSYRKIHLFSLMKEDHFLKPGKNYSTFSHRILSYFRDHLL